MTKRENKGVFGIAFAAVAGLMLASGAAEAALITGTTATGTGSFNNSPSLIVDGFIPAEGSFYAAATNVNWSGTGPQFTIDLGALYDVQDLLLSLDNNDSYQVSYSTDNSSFMTLFTVPSGAGEIGNGMDTFSTAAGDPEYVGAIDFATTSMRYLRVAATGGDNLYSIGEVQAFSAPTVTTSEPGVLGLFSMGLLALGLARFRRRKAA